jgi:hypothetical protein
VDFCYDQTTDTTTLKVLSVTDEFTREALAIRVDRSITADHTVTVLEEIVASTGRSPAYIRMDNGPEMTAHALRDWCRYACTDTSYIEPGHPFTEPIHRIVYRQAARRAARGRDIRHAVGGQDPGRGLPHRRQLTTTPFGARLPDPEGGRRRLDPITHPDQIRGGTGIGVRSARRCSAPVVRDRSTGGDRPASAVAGPGGAMGVPRQPGHPTHGGVDGVELVTVEGVIGAVDVLEVGRRTASVARELGK